MNAEFAERRFRENIATSRDRLDELDESPPDPCPQCGHIPYPIVATQHCWCEPFEVVELELPTH